MEKRISFFEFQSVKSVAKAIEPKQREQKKLRTQIEKLAAEYKQCETDIADYEAGIVKVIGFHVADLVQKVMETRVSKNGEEIKVTKYVPTDIVTYDENTKEYIITVPEENGIQEEAQHTEEETVGNGSPTPEPPMTTVGNDYDMDGSMPFEQPNENSEEIF